LAWQVLPAHTIRSLAKHPGRPAPPPVDVEDAVRGWHLVPSALRGRVYTAVDAVVAGINTIFNGLSAPDLETDWGGASEE
jgi:hypothetical protein